MPIRSRCLTHNETGKLWATSCEGTVVTIKTGLPDKLKSREKIFNDPEAALKYAAKEEWARLKKGFILSAPTPNLKAENGQPSLHLYVGGGYTGALLVTEYKGQILTNVDPKQHDDDESSKLWCVSRNGDITTRLSLLPNHLAQEAVPKPDEDKIFLRLNHDIWQWTPDPKPQKRSLWKLKPKPKPALQELMAGGAKPASFLSAASGRYAGYANGHVLVYNDGGAELFRREIESELYSGHSLQMEGALSPDGRRLAVCSRAGLIDIFNQENGETAQITGDFEMISKLQFSPDGSYLIAREMYGGWRLLAFDIAAKAPLESWPDFGNIANGDFALDPKTNRLAVRVEKTVSLYDLTKFKKNSSFDIEHMVKKANVAWIDGNIAVRTDYGCLSVYAV
ncbi:MAG: WD40 repeat domain-containing protein [Maricaulaceae bacterium]